MGLLYTLGAENLSTGTGYVLVSIATSATEANRGGELKLRRVEVGQSGTATAAMCRIAISKRDTAGTLTITSATPAALRVGGFASIFTGGTNGLTALNCGVNSSADSGGTYTNLYVANFCNLNGWLWIPTPGEEFHFTASQIACVRFLAAPGTTTGWSINIVFEEI